MSYKGDIFRKMLAEKIIVLDGAMGTMVQNYKLTEDDFRGELFKDHPVELKGLNDLLVVSKPEVIAEIHKSFLKNGADVIETCTFNATSVSLEDYQMSDQVYEINKQAATLAGRVVQEFLAENCDRENAFVAGSIGPTTKTSSIAVDTNNPSARAINFDELVTAYTEQIKGLIDGGVDLFLVETVFDPLNAKAALFALNRIFQERELNYPVLLSATVTESGRLLSGQTIEGFWNSIRHFSPDGFGLNCSLGGEQMLPFIREAARVAACPVICYPNAGLPNQFGKYDQTPEIMASCIEKFIQEGLINMVGGCCGTSPEHIGAIAAITRNITPRVIPELKTMMRLSGLEPLNVDGTVPFMEIGERANVMGSRKFARLIKEKNYDEALDIAKGQVENGGSVIDINMDEGMLDAAREMVNFINLINSDPEVSRVPLMVDSSDWDVIEAGLKCLPGKGIVNSLSLKEGEEDFLGKASIVKNLGAALVVMAFDEKGQADTYERKVEIAERAYKLLTEKIAFPPEDIIFDLNVFAVGTGMAEHAEYGVDFLRALETVRKELPLCHASGGLSNLSFSFRGNNPVREAMHAVFLEHAIPMGLDFAIVNPGKLPAVTDIDPDLKRLSEAIILNKDGLSATEELIEKADSFKGIKKEVVNDERWRREETEERLKYALVKGISRYIEEDLQELLNKNLKALVIIETVLMGGMKRVGDLFGDGLMFLPQVIKSARVMRLAVDYLKPYLEKSDDESSKAGKVLLATVKGDVHDIGKNIVDLVLSCNNFDVINMGEMVPCEDILQKAREEQVDIIGLSGLITPSLREMENVASEMEKQNFSIPLFVGGAATSKAHTAVKIAPNYSRGVSVYCRDASETVTVASKILNKEQRDNFISEIQEDYSQQREKHRQNEENLDLLPLEKSRKMNIPYNDYQPVEPSFLGARAFLPIDLKEVSEMIDWQYFLVEWGITGGSLENVLQDEVKGPEARKIIAEGKDLLRKIIEENLLEARGVIGFYPAKSDGDDLLIFEDKQCLKLKKRIPMLRQQTAGYKGCCFCVADWISSEKTDYVGLFTFTAGINLKEEKKKLDEDRFSGFMMQVMANRLAEACCEYYNDLAARELWGYSPDGSAPGIRPAPGYPATPDHRQKKDIFEILEVEKKINVSLTDRYMMEPESSVCGFFIAHPESRYFGIGKILPDQLADYSKRRGESIEENKDWLATMIVNC